MRLGRYYKTPNENKRYRIDYTNWLDTDEYVSDLVLETVSTNTIPLTMVADTISGTDKVASFFVSGGGDGETYNIAARMTSSGNQIKEDIVTYVVRAL